MFNLSTQDVVSSIKKTPITKQGNFVYQHYHNFFGNNSYLQFNDNSIGFEKLRGQEDFPRRRLPQSAALSKKLRLFFMNSRITNSLEEKFSTPLKFSSVDYWIDNRGYFLPSHIDNKSIKLSLQIYIGEDHPGTVLFDNDKELHTFKFKNNSGYAMLLHEKAFHGLEYPVRHNGRQSIYVRYQ